MNFDEILVGVFFGVLVVVAVIAFVLLVKDDEGIPPWK